MTEPGDKVVASAAPTHGNPASDLAERWQWLGHQPHPPVPAGAVGTLANRVLVYTRRTHIPTVLPALATARSGLMITGPGPGKPIPQVTGLDYDGPIAIDPDAYGHHQATPDKPFLLPDDGLAGTNPTLDQVLDAQLRAGYTVACTPTGYIGAGDIASLAAAAQQVKALGRTDTLFVAPLDISLIDRAFFTQTQAILHDVGCPIALVLGKQGDPLTQSVRIIPNLRTLAATVPLMPICTDFNGLDLVAHGAFAAAIGTGGSIRHTVPYPREPLSFNGRDKSPSVLVPDLMCWWKGSKINELSGAAPSRAPRCRCGTCGDQALTRFLQKEDQPEAIAHAVAAWTVIAEGLLDQPTVRERAAYWRNICVGALNEHEMLAKRLRRPDAFEPQAPLKRWATLPAWPAE
ncbi:hypothetical protein ACQP2E_04740 [Actinoplanes sp. CA-015351]|uniref:hypothetical protein n=1 Tax=Actinoplanes sp. CA-015351 TaxID=3239897 RepID=UPI003D9571F1